MAIKRIKLMADFETTTDPDDVRVWAGCAVDVDALEVSYIGNNLDGFMDYLQNKNTVCYFHNLKFDGEFILYWLLKHGYTYTPGVDKDGKRLPLKTKQFTALITDDGLFYSLEVMFDRVSDKKHKKVTFYDSLKKLPFKVSVIAKAFELSMSKGEIDYNAPRPVGYELTPEEKDYIVRDCQIVAEALKIQFEQGLKKMTNASDAMNGYKNIIGLETFDKWFPKLPFELDAEIRRAYKGGYVYLNPKYRNRRGLKGITLDVNSLYPWAMYTCLLPYGYPMFFEGAPEPDENYPLFIVHLKCCFELKPGHLPTLQLKNNGRFVETEYLTTSRVKIGKHWENEPVEMWLTSVDYQLLLDHYELSNETYFNGFKFKGAVGMFKDYIDYWMHIKETTTGALRQLAKLMLNSLYGRFATNPKKRKKVPYLDKEDDVVRYTYTDYEITDPVYTAMGAFITAYARNKTIRSGQAVFDRFIYADTDSLHLVGQDVPEGLEVHPTHLGAWKNEGCFEDSKFLRAKTYMESEQKRTDDTLKNYAKLLDKPFVHDLRRAPNRIDYRVAKITCAGMPDNIKEEVTYDNFQPGATFDGKLMPRRFPGGIVLMPTTFTIK